jgi:hypothetical protein
LAPTPAKIGITSDMSRSKNRATNLAQKWRFWTP